MAEEPRGGIREPQADPEVLCEERVRDSGTSAQRCHWDDEWAQRMGHPAAYDYGVMRTNWMAHLVTDWMGDDAWIWKVSAAVGSSTIWATPTSSRASS